MLLVHQFQLESARRLDHAVAVGIQSRYVDPCRGKRIHEALPNDAAHLGARFELLEASDGLTRLVLRDLGKVPDLECATDGCQGHTEQSIKVVPDRSGAAGSVDLIQQVLLERPEHERSRVLEPLLVFDVRGDERLWRTAYPDEPPEPEFVKVHRRTNTASSYPEVGMKEGVGVSRGAG